MSIGIKPEDYSQSLKWYTQRFDSLKFAQEFHNFLFKVDISVLQYGTIKFWLKHWGETIISQKSAGVLTSNSASDVIELPVSEETYNFDCHVPAHQQKLTEDQKNSFLAYFAANANILFKVSDIETAFSHAFTFCSLMRVPKTLCDDWGVEFNNKNN